DRGLLASWCKMGFLVLCLVVMGVAAVDFGSLFDLVHTHQVGFVGSFLAFFFFLHSS
ncbi:hypothetical protein BDP55DRAFT_644964, partial [Colletotrichum godetiae]